MVQDWSDWKPNIDLVEDDVDGLSYLSSCILPDGCAHKRPDWHLPPQRHFGVNVTFGKRSKVRFMQQQ